MVMSSVSSHENRLSNVNIPLNDFGAESKVTLIDWLTMFVVVFFVVASQLPLRLQRRVDFGLPNIIRIVIRSN